MSYYDNEVVPFEDTTMTYDSDKHRYVLTIQAVDDEFNVSLVSYAGSVEDAESMLREVSNDMYKYIYKYNRRDEKKRRAVEHLLAKNGDLRDLIRDSMLDMVRAIIRGGYSLQKDLSWVNPETGLVMDLSNIPAIAPSAIDGLFGGGVLFKGRFTYQIDADDYRSDY